MPIGPIRLHGLLRVYVKVLPIFLTLRPMRNFIFKPTDKPKNKQWNKITLSLSIYLPVCRDISLKRPWFNQGTKKGIKIVDKNPLVFFCCMLTLFWFHFCMKCQRLYFAFLCLFTFSFFFLLFEWRLLFFFLLWHDDLTDNVSQCIKTLFENVPLKFL